MSGPLEGIRVLEFAGLGPGPFCAMALAGMGANVLRIERLDAPVVKGNVLARGRSAVAIDLKSEEGAATALGFVEKADALIEGFRPGVMERLGLGPEVCLARNPRLAYGRMTGWGQTGALSGAAGHDINYIALSGVLHAIGEAGGKPVPPLNLVGDFGGGGMLLAFGLVCAILEARKSGRGQVVDAAMVDGAALQMASTYGLKAAGRWTNNRGTNYLDGGAPFYGTYECADGKYVAIGSIEPQFYQLLFEKLGLSVAEFQPQMDQRHWADWKHRLAAVFRTRTRDEWCALMEGTDVCFAPVLDMDEAPRHPHNVHRGTFFEADGVVQPAPAPRFSRTPANSNGCDLEAWGISNAT